MKTEKQFKDIQDQLDQDNMILSTIQVKKTMSGKRSAKQQFKSRKFQDNVQNRINEVKIDEGGLLQVSKQ